MGKLRQKRKRVRPTGPPKTGPPAEDGDPGRPHDSDVESVASADPTPVSAQESHVPEIPGMSTASYSSTAPAPEPEQVQPPPAPSSGTTTTSTKKKKKKKKANSGMNAPVVDTNNLSEDIGQTSNNLSAQQGTAVGVEEMHGEGRLRGGAGEHGGSSSFDYQPSSRRSFDHQSFDEYDPDARDDESLTNRAQRDLDLLDKMGNYRREVAEITPEEYLAQYYSRPGAPAELQMAPQHQRMPPPTAAPPLPPPAPAGPVPRGLLPMADKKTGKRCFSESAKERVERDILQSQSDARLRVGQFLEHSLYLSCSIFNDESRNMWRIRSLPFVSEGV